MPIYQKISNEISRQEKDYIHSLKELVQIPSVLAESSMYPFGEPINQALEKMLEICEELGFTVYKDPQGYYGFAEIGTGQEMIGILGHLDVVPAGNISNWHTDPFEAVMKDGKIYGRGTQDDKGPTLATVYAVKALMNIGVSFNKRVRLIFGTDEETLWRGMEQYKLKEEMPTMGFTPDSSFPLIYAEKGLLQVQLKGRNESILELKGGDAFNAVPSSVVYKGDKQTELEDRLQELGFHYEKAGEGILVLGKPAHAQVPEEGINAISRLAIALYEIGKQSKTIDFIYELIKEDPFATSIFGNVEDEASGKLKFNIGKLEITKEECLSIDIRIPVTGDKEEVVKHLKQAASKYGLTYMEFDYLPSIYIPKSDPFIQTLLKVYRETTGDEVSEPKSSGGATYARAMNRCVAFGAIFPEQEKVEHQPNEFIEIEKMMKAMEIYAKSIYLLGR